MMTLIDELVWMRQRAKKESGKTQAAYRKEAINWQMARACPWLFSQGGMMELKEFVSRTLTEIAEGVAEGAISAQKSGAIVNPLNVYMGGESRYAESVDIEFTVGLSVTDATHTKGGIGVVAGIFAIGSQGASNASTGSTTHIKFTVPVILPSLANRTKT